MGYNYTFNRDYNYLAHFNKNHDPKNGRFTFGDGNGDGIYGRANPNDYRTPELDKKYAELKKTGATEVHNLEWLYNNDDAEKVWGKDYVESAKIGLAALVKYRGYNEPEMLEVINGTADNATKNSELSWFVFEDQTPGYMEIAHLVNKGWSKEKIMDMIRTCDYDFNDKNSEFEDAYTGYPNNEDWDKLFSEAFDKAPYPGTYSLGETLESGTDKYIDACIEAKEELKHSGVNDMDYLIHFNKNHSKANGQFISGDGDADGIIDDHHNYSRNRINRTSGSDIHDTRSLKKSGSSTLNSQSLKKISVSSAKKAAIATAGVVAAAATAAVIVKMYNSKSAGSYGIESTKGAKWLEAGQLYKASKARVVGGDW